MPPEIQETPAIQTPNFIFPEDIKVACEEVAKRCFEHTDPTRVSVRYLQEEEKVYPCYGRYDDEIQKYPLMKEILRDLGILRRKSGKYHEHNLITHVFRGILNICQLIDDGDTLKTYSLPLNPANIQERLTFPEILADIILYQVLTGCNDRKIQLQDDPRTRTHEWIVPHNCRIFSQGSYSIFDIEGTFEKVEKDEVEELMYYHLKYLFSEYEIEARDFQEHIDGDIAFGQTMIERIKKKVSELLERYDSSEGKALFIRQCAESHISHRYIPERLKNTFFIAPDIYYSHEEIYYQNLLLSLKNIQDFFETQEEPFRNTAFLRKDAKRKVRYHLRKFFQYMKQYFFPSYTI